MQHPLTAIFGNGGGADLNLTRENITPNQKQHVLFDPMTKMPVWGGSVRLTVPYTEEARGRIVAWAEKLASPSERLPERGMTERPVSR